MRTLIISFLAIVSISLPATSKKTDRILVSDVYDNFKKASGRIVEATGTVTEILYTGNSIRFGLEFAPGKPVVIESYNDWLMQNTKPGSYFRLCGIFLKYRKLKYNKKETELPVILVDKQSCD